MSDPVQSVLDAITLLGERIAAQTAPAGVQATPVTGTLGLTGLRPTVTVSQLLDPKDIVRISGSITVDEAAYRLTPSTTTSGGSGGQSTIYTNKIVRTLATTRKVYLLDDCGAVQASGQTVVFPPLPVRSGIDSGAASTTVNNGNLTNLPFHGTGLDGTIGSLTFVTGAITLLTRYHYG